MSNFWTPQKLGHLTNFKGFSAKTIKIIMELNFEFIDSNKENHNNSTTALL
jgi:hypothetical protein